MKKGSNLFKKIVSYFLAFMMFLPLTLWHETEKVTVRASAYSISTADSYSGNFKVHFIDVGQGDCILVQQGNTNMLTDGGTNEAEGTIFSPQKSSYKDIK